MPTYWNGLNLWYLDVQILKTIANQGTMGSIPEGSWLPALPDGTSMGPKPDDENQRYQDLYEKFADAWRVTKDTSLFDYDVAASEGTEDFTLDEWPRNHPQNCDLPNQTSLQPATAAQAQQACSAITDPVMKADCEFDVTLTGNTGFGASYQRLQEYTPVAAGWQVNLPTTGQSAPPDGGGSAHWPWWWWIVLLIILILIIWFFVRRKGTP